MNRRSFIGSLLLGALAPSVFVPRFEPVRWKRQRDIWVPNPDYYSAPYEIQFIFQTGLWQITDASPRNIDGSLFPVRFREGGRWGLLERVEPFIKA